MLDEMSNDDQFCNADGRHEHDMGIIQGVLVLHDGNQETSWYAKSSKAASGHG